MAIAASPWTILARGIAAGVSCLLILGVINMQAVDISMYGIPQEYLPVMLVAGLVIGLMTSFLLRSKLHNDAADNKVAEGKITSTNALPYDKRYDAMTIAGFILGVASGIALTPVAVDYLFIGAGMWTFAIVAGILSGVCSAFWIYTLHFGIRTAIIDAAKYAVSVKDAVQEAETIVGVNPKK